MSNYHCVRIVHHRYHICVVHILCGYEHVMSNYHCVRIVHHRYHICVVHILCGYEHVMSNYHYVRIVHHGYHIWMVYPLCGYEHETSNYLLVRNVHHRYHICMFCFPLCGYGHVSLNYHFVRIVHHIYHIYKYGLSPVWIWTWALNWPRCENCAPQVSHLYGLSTVSSIKNIWRIVHHRYNTWPVFLQCGYGHGLSNYNCMRIVNHKYHICMVYPLWIRRCLQITTFWELCTHICMVSHQYGCGHAAISLDCVKNVCHKCYIWIVSQ